MSLDLDDRQRAMLAEMGVRVWWPLEPEAGPLAAHPADLQNTIKKEAASAYAARSGGHFPVNVPSLTGPDGVPTTPDPPPPAIASGSASPVTPGTAGSATRMRSTAQGDIAAVASRLGPTGLKALPEGIAEMDWQGLTNAVAGCQACHMCLGRRAAVLVAPPEGQRCDWMVLGEPPDDAQERAQLPFVDEAGRLLDNMLKAVGVKRCATQAAGSEAPAGALELPHSAHLSLVAKCRPARPATPSALALATCSHYLKREIALLQPRVILAMGRIAMQVLLKEDQPDALKLPLGKLRGQVWRYQGVPVVVTYPPVYLLRNGLDKASAWQDLCLAAEVAQGTQSA